MPNRFAPAKVAEQPEEIVPYDHGFTPLEVERIKSAKLELDKKIERGYKHSLDEFKTIIVPHLRIHRTEAFILNPEKEKKVRVAKEPGQPRQTRAKGEPKVKKLTKKEISARLDSIIMKMAMQQAISEDEQAFFNEHTSQKVI